MFSRASLRDFRCLACVLFCLVLAIAAAGGAYLAFAKKEKVGSRDDRQLLSEAREWLASADKAIAEKNWPRANVLLRWGIHTVGNDFRPANIIDDSEFSLFRADREEMNGNIQSAVEERRILLVSRLEMLQVKICEATASRSDQCPEKAASGLGKL